MKWTSWLTLVALALLAGGVVWSSLRVGQVDCEVCMEFRGSRACRTVEGATTDEARRAAVSNACALLATGVTDTLACERTPPAAVRCSP